jgi:glycosyltransferase involved in cell wall biosynthesis
MRCPRLKDLPEPPSGKRGWPWTEESTPLLGSLPNSREWPRITVITPSFNQARFIEETLRSVLLQGYSNLEYLVLDGGSTDGSVDIIKRYSSWIDYWTSESDGGQSVAINRGLRMGSGQWATWINSDDLLCKDALVRQVSQMALLSEGTPTSDTVYAGICLIIDTNRNVLFSHRGRVHCLDDLVRIRTVWRSGGYIVQPEVLFPRKLALAVGGLDPGNHYTMDYELWGKLFLAGAEIRYTDTPFGMFRKHSNQKTHDMLRQTRSLLDTAAKLVMQADLWPDSTRDAILQDLRAYGEAYEASYWPGTGRLARLGLPRGIVTGLRRVKNFLLEVVPFRTIRE